MPLMPKEEFAKQVTDYVRIGLAEELDVRLEEKIKNNDTKQYYIYIGAEEERAVPSISLEEQYGRYVQGRCTVLQAAGDIVDLYEQVTIQMQAVKPEDWELLDYERVKQRLGLRIVEIQRNHEWLQDKPYVPVGNGLAKTFVVYALETEEEAYTVNITDQMMEQWGCGLGQMEADAIENEMRIHPAVFGSIDAVMERMLTGEENALSVVQTRLEDTARLEPVNGGLNMYVLSNEKGAFGSSCLFYPGVKEKLGDLFGDDYYVFPGSVHECIVLPASAVNIDLDALKTLTAEINRMQVNEQEQLSDNVMLYEKGRGLLTMPFTEIPPVPQKSAAEVSGNMKRIIETAGTGVQTIPSGTFKYGQLEQLKRESQILGVEKYLNFQKGNCDIEIQESFLDQFDLTGKDLSRYQENTKVQGKKFDSPKL